jgi:hypothetical protein
LAISMIRPMKVELCLGSTIVISLIIFRISLVRFAT